MNSDNPKSEEESLAELADRTEGTGRANDYGQMWRTTNDEKNMNNGS